MKAYEIPAEVLRESLPSLRTVAQLGCYIADTGLTYDVDAMSRLFSHLILAAEAAR